ncbi:MAG: peptidylprolyl isomerase [Candidatus Eisenbacteria bacterium]
MRRLLVAALLAVLVAGVASCGRGGDPDTLARVGGATLSADEFYASIPEQLLAVMSLEDQEEALRAWVKTELFYQEGVRRGVDKDAAMERRLREIERELVAEEYIKRFMEEVPDVPEDEAREYFEDHQDEYSLQVRLAHILVRNRPEAERALEQIRSGTPFDTVASASSIDQTASMGGDLGYMRRGEMLHELEGDAFSLKVGEVSGVIASSYGYHIIKVQDRHPGAGRPTFDSRYAAVMNFLTSQRRRGAFDERLADLSGRASVVVDTAALRVAARSRLSDTSDDPSADGILEDSAEDEEAGAP